MSTNTPPSDGVAPVKADAKESVVRIYRRFRRQTRLAIEDLLDWREASFARLLGRHKRRGRLSLIFDHRMGGGSNIFRDKLIAETVGSGRTSVLLVTIGRDDRQIECHLYRSKPARHRPVSMESLFRLLSTVAFDDILINDLVTWPNPIEVIASIRSLAAHQAAPLTIYFHDHFFLCPSWTLLNYLDRFCGLPDLQACDHCLKHHEDRFVKESDVPGMAAWRAACGALLADASRIVCFSNYTADLIRQCFPGRALAITVKPHTLLFEPTRFPRPDFERPLRIGVLGNIGFHKGARIVDAMSDLIAERGIDARIIVIGRYSRPVRNGIVVHGKYERSELADLIDAHGIHVFLFPSIWPETFSYVCAEIMALKMPLVAFDLGAPAERLRDYPLGLLVDEVSAEKALDAAVALYDRSRSAALREKSAGPG